MIRRECAGTAKSDSCDREDSEDVWFGSPEGSDVQRAQAGVFDIGETMGPGPGPAAGEGASVQKEHLTGRDRRSHSIPRLTRTLRCV